MSGTPDESFRTLPARGSSIPLFQIGGAMQPRNPQPATLTVNSHITVRHCPGQRCSHVGNRLRADHAVFCPESPQWYYFCAEDTDFLRFRYSYHLRVCAPNYLWRQQLSTLSLHSMAAETPIQRFAVIMRHFSCSPKANTRGRKADFHRVLERKNVAVG